MSSRVFQSVVLQMKDSTDRAIGVIDSEGTVVACNELTCIGEKWTGAVEAINEADTELVAFDGNTFKPLAGWSSQFDYAAFARGEDDAARMVCSMAAVALNGAKAYYEEKHDKGTFVKSIISDNILLGDIYVRAKELHFTSEAPRAVFLVRQVGTTDMAAIDVVQSLFPDKQVDFVLSINETDIALIKQLSDGTERPFEEGDTVTLTVAWAMGPEVLQKTVTSFQEGAAFVLLNHEDTNDLTPGEYAYDVQLTAKDGMVATIIPPARFVLEGDVTRD